jgi:CheY-like chemotaxis protein
VDSTVGVGTTFSLFFPRELATPRQVSRTPHSDRPRAKPGETLLLIEDEASVREVTAKLLAKLGYTVVTAVDGLDGVEKAATHEGRLDIVISDLMMPVLGGVEAVTRILEKRPNLPVLFVSGYSESALRWSDGAPRVGKLLQKPFSVDDLAHAVRTAIDG